MKLSDIVGTEKKEQQKNMTPTTHGEMILYSSCVRENARNAIYPTKNNINSLEDLLECTKFDHVCAAYKGYKRSNDTFISSNCLPMDCDNGENENPESFVTPTDVMKAFKDVAFYIVYSRNHMKEKNGKKPRPKFHVYFPIPEMTQMEMYTELKERIYEYFPAFDTKALDAARFFYGVESPKGEYFDGKKNVFEFMCEQKQKKQQQDIIPQAEQKKQQTDIIPQAEQKKQQTDIIPQAEQKKQQQDIIPQGARNSTLSKFAAIVVKRYGDKDGTALEAFRKEAQKCSPPLDEKELNSIWKSALSFYNNKVKNAAGYISPEEYNKFGSLEPTDYTDIGQANIFVRVYGDNIRYNESTKYLIYDGRKWLESDVKAQGLSQELTEMQILEAEKRRHKAMEEKREADKSGDISKKATAQNKLSLEQAFYKFVLSRRNINKVIATLTAATPKIYIDAKELDKNGFLLNTPNGVVDLKTGKKEPFNPDNYCTKITAVAQDDKNAEIFSDFLYRVTCGDKELENYLQEVAGMCAIGKVLRENIIIAYGTGGNGKSTFFNLLFRVMGDYAGMLSAETLTRNCRKNKSPEYAELRGKRIIIAAELEEGMRLDTSIVKKLCSTDPILAEKKYKDPFSFMPSHTVILYTNHLPKIGTTDKGTWDRIIAIPFEANFRGSENEKLNYADYLFDTCGGAVLTWVIEGAKRFVANNYKIRLPKCVKEAIAEYRANNDWLAMFIDECCEVNPDYKVKSSDLINKYRDYCRRTYEFARSQNEFKKELEDAGYRTRKEKDANYIYGLKLVEEQAFTPYNGKTPFD